MISCVASNCGGVVPPNRFNAHTSYWKLMLPPKLSLCAWLLAFTSSPARIAPNKLVAAPAPPVKETLPRTRISPYQFKPPLISRSPSTIKMPDPLAAEVKWTLPGMYSVTELLAALRAAIFIGSGRRCKVLGACASKVWECGAGPVLIDQIVDIQRVW